MPNIYPSVASCRLINTAQEIARLKDWPFLHFDIEDGNFVPNITFGMKFIRAAREISQAAFDAHLMVTDPMAYIPDLLNLGFQSIAVHRESLQYPLAALHTIRSAGAKAGLALNPGTPVEAALLYLDKVDYVLLMATEADGCGERFQAATLDKIRAIRTHSDTLSIWVDGDVNESNIGDIVEAGADSVVIGRSIFCAKDARLAAEHFAAIGAAP